MAKSHYKEGKNGVSDKMALLEHRVFFSRTKCACSRSLNIHPTIAMEVLQRIERIGLIMSLLKKDTVRLTCLFSRQMSLRGSGGEGREASLEGREGHGAGVSGAPPLRSLSAKGKGIRRRNVTLCHVGTHRFGCERAALGGERSRSAGRERSCLLERQGACELVSRVARAGVVCLGS